MSYICHPTVRIKKVPPCTYRASSKPFQWPANSVCSSDITSIIKDTAQAGARGPEEEADLFCLCANYAPRLNAGTFSLSILSLFDSIPEAYEAVQGSVQSSIQNYYESVAQGNGFLPFVYHYYNYKRPVMSIALHAWAGQWHRKRISPIESIQPISSSSSECPSH